MIWLVFQLVSDCCLAVQPMTFAEQKLKQGLIKPEDVPYMQRPGGRPDDSDLKKPKKGGMGSFKLPWQK